MGDCRSQKEEDETKALKGRKEQLTAKLATLEEKRQNAKADLAALRKIMAEINAILINLNEIEEILEAAEAEGEISLWRQGISSTLSTLIS